MHKRLYKTHTPCIHCHLRDKTHRSLSKSFPPHPSTFPLELFLHWRSPLPFCLLFLFPSSQFLGLCSRQVSHFATEVLLVTFSRSVFFVLFPFCLQYFLSCIFCLGCICFQCFPCYYFPAFAPGISVLQGSLIPRRITGAYVASFPILSSQHRSIFQVAIP